MELAQVPELESAVPIGNVSAGRSADFFPKCIQALSAAADEVGADALKCNGLACEDLNCVRRASVIS